MLDSIDAAEEMHEEIVYSLLRAAAIADSVEALRGPLRVLRTWQDREPGNRDMLVKIVRHLERDTREGRIRTALALNLVSLGWDDQEVRLVSQQLYNLATRDGQVYATCLFTGDRPTHTLLLTAEQELLRALLNQTTKHSYTLRCNYPALSF